jgi:hypothetical protein
MVDVVGARWDDAERVISMIKEMIVHERRKWSFGQE